MKICTQVACMHIMQHHLLSESIFRKCLLVLLCSNSFQILAQYWTVDTAYVTMDASAMVNPITDFPICDNANAVNSFSAPLIEVLPPFAIEPVLVRYLETEVGNPVGTDCQSLAEGVGLARITGYNTDEITLIFNAYAGTGFFGECVCIFALDAGAPEYFYNVEAFATYDAEVVLKADGFLPSSTVTAYYTATVFTWVVNKKEMPADDSVRIDFTRVEMDGIDLFAPGAFNVIDADIGFAENKREYNGSIIFNSDSLLTISTSAFVKAYISDQDGTLFPAPYDDIGDVQFYVAITLSLVSTPSIPTVNATNCPPSDETLLFSLDIGSDSELGGNISGIEYFDSGDMYAWKSALPGVPFNGYIDDLLFFGTDYPLDPAGVLSDITCAGGTITPTDYFDLDAFDAISIDLSGYPFLPGNPFINAGIVYPCIYLPEYITVSFDEDDGYDYANGFPDCSVPVFSSNPLGTSAGYNEVYADYFPVNIYSTLNPRPLAKAPFIDEEDLHDGLYPNPDPILSAMNDDVDALDFICTSDPCIYNYFSADHEATGADIFLSPLDPGIIYLASGGVPVPVILPDFLGLTPGVDIDAFEFCWLIHPTLSQYALALLFSVNTDDPNTPADESSGLNPGYIYGSFMEFSNFPLLTSFNSNVDAIGISAYPVATNHMQLELNTSADSICRGETVTLSASGADYYVWSPDMWLSSTTGSTVTAKPKATITYTVIGFKGGGTKSDTAEVTITVSPKPGVVITAAGSTVICPGDSVILTANSYHPLQYRWQLNGVTIAGANTATYVAYSAGNYSVKVMNAAGCRNISNVITVDNCVSARMHVDDAFVVTPNPGEGKVILSYVSLTSGSLEVNLYSSDGVLVESFTEIFANSEHVIELDLPSGIYYFVGTDTNGYSYLREYILQR